jgi:hypothetical protein
MALAMMVAFSTAHANELDNENQVKNAQRLAAHLPQTLVVREDANGNVAVLHSAEKLVPGVKLDDSKFVQMNKTDKMKELDGDSSASGWYFFWYNYSYSYPTYYYYGYTYYYRPYYSYYYNNCQYRWYNWRRWW